jgi:four helix bundle protein
MSNGMGLGSWLEGGTMKGDDIARRLLSYGVGVMGLMGKFSKHTGAKHVAQQLARSGTAPGAHYEEARRSESRADFVHKLRIAAKEAGESVYWLRLAHHARLVDADVGPLVQEGTELTAILAASVATARCGMGARTDDGQARRNEI